MVAGCDQTTAPELNESRVHVRASWSTDGTTIAFTATIKNVTGLYLVDSSGSNIRLLQAGNIIGSTWSPDSKWLVFQKDGSLFRIKANGDSATQLMASVQDYRPAWSPDGNKIVFVRSGLFLYDVQAGTATSLNESGDYPSWHPDGEIVAVSKQYSGLSYLYTYVFVAIRPDSMTTRTLASFNSNSELAVSPVSPRGSAPQEIVFGLLPQSGFTQLWKIDLVAGTMTQLTFDGGDYPAWSPDGSKIVYTCTQPADGALWIINANGSGRRRLTSP
jgi:Tol biopolymer transport system component